MKLDRGVHTGVYIVSVSTILMHEAGGGCPGGCELMYFLDSFGETFEWLLRRYPGRRVVTRVILQ